MPANARTTDLMPNMFKTLHDRMILEAENIIQENWTQVAINDKNRLALGHENCAFVWIVRPEGSNLFAMSQWIHCRENYEMLEEHGVCSEAEAFFLRCQDYFVKFRNKFDPTKYKYYIVIKGRCAFDGQIIPSTFQEVLDLVFVGQLRWTDSGMQPTGKTFSAWETQWIGAEQ